MVNKVKIARLLAAFVFVILAVCASAQTRVTTDKKDYEPGSTATISGHGWYPNSNVVLHVVHTEGRPNTRPNHRPFSVKTDSHGNFTAPWFVDPIDSLGASFLLTADCQPEGMVVQHQEWRFTDKSSTTTTIVSNSNPSTFGGSVTFAITVSSAPNTPAPTGTVDLTDGATTLATLTVTGATSTTSTATYTTSTLTGGSHTMAASYNGDGNYRGSNSSNLTQTVNKAATTPSVVSSQNPAITGANVTFTATVTGVGGATNPSGNVTFKDGATTLGTGAVSGSVATFSTSSLTAGSHSITAVYAGDTNYTTSTSSILTQVINAPIATSTALGSSANSANEGVSITFTATVTGGAAPTGTVTFKDGVTTLGTGALNGSGVATFSTATLTPGSHSITAVYGGDGTHSGSTSSIVSQQIMGNTTISVGSNHLPAVFGQSITFTATITTSTGSATGTVTFKDGATTLGTGTLAGNSATFSTSALSVATHSITAVYAGDSNYNGSTSSALSQVVNQGSTTTAVVSGTNPSIQGASVTFTATVSVTAPATGTPTGTVTFKDGAATLGTGALSGTSATFSTSSLSAGTHTISVVYGGDTNFTSSTSSNLTQTVNSSSTTIAVASNHNPAVIGQSVTLTATVTTTSGTATGNVTFMDGATTLGTGTLSANVATLTTSALTIGTHSITAVYAGDSTYTGSTSSILSQVVNKGSTTTAVATSGTPSFPAQSVTFTATVSVTAPASGTPTGTVTFKDGATALGTGTLSGNTATFVTSTLAIGSHTISAVYAGDGNFNTSTSSNFTQVVSDNSTNLTLGSSLNPSTYLQSVTFTARLTDSGGTKITGATVTFRDNGVSIGTGVTNPGGNATLAISTLTAGTHPITATFAGNLPSQAASTSPTVSQVVNKATATVTITNTTQTYNGSARPVTTSTTPAGLTVNVTYNGSATAPTNAGSYAVVGTISDANYQGSSSTTLTVNKATATVTLSGLSKTYTAAPQGVTVATTPSGMEGEVSVTYNGSATQPTNVGSYPIVATLTDTNYTGSASGTFAITKATPTVNVTGGNFGYDGNSHPATGSVIGVASENLGTPTFTYTPGGATAPTAPGTYSVSGDFAGNANYNSASGSATITIGKGDQTITFGALTNKTFGDADFALSATASSNLAVTFSVVSGPATIAGTTLTLTGAGSVTIRASQAGDSNYNAATPVDQTFTVGKATPVVNANDVTATYDGNPHPATGTVTGVGGVDLGTPTFTYTPGGSTAPTNAGTYTATGSFAGNADYNSASSSAVAITINKASATLSLSNLSQTYDGSPKPVTITTTPASLSGVTVTYAGSSTVPTNAGTYTVVASLTNTNYTATNATGSLTIDKAHATLSLSGLSTTYDGSPKSVTVTTNPGSLDTVTTTYDGSATAPTNAGTYAVVATLNNANYDATDATGSLIIAKADQTITFGALANKRFGNPDVTLSATSTSGLPVGFAGTAPATISGSTMSFPAAGGTTVTITVTASQTGDANHNPAPDVTQSFTLKENIKPTSNGSSAPTPNASGWNTQAVTVTITATDNPGGDGVLQVHYSIDGALLTTVPGDTASFLYGVDGAHTVTFHAEDNAGNIEDDQTLTIKVDLNPPTIFANPSRSPDNNGWYTAPVDISFTANDGNGSGVDNATVTAPIHYTGPDSKTAFVDADASDIAGNTAHRVYNFKYDATAPIITVTGLTGSIHESVNYDISATDSGSGANITLQAQLKKDGVLVWNSTDTDIAPALPEQSISGAANDGNYHLDVVATDEAGNQSTQSYDFVIDNQAPIITFLPSSPQDGGVYNSAQTISYTITSSSGIASTIETLLSEIASVNVGPSALTSGTTVSQDGRYTVHLAATDTLGHQAQLDRTFTIDSVAPTLDDAELSGSAAPNAGWFESNVSVTLSAGDPQIRTTPTVINGSGVQSIFYYATGAQPLGSLANPIVVSGSTAAFNITTEGTTTITYWAVDVAGNQTQTKSVDVKYDKTPPTFGTMSDITTTADLPTGKVVTFTLPTPTDNLDANPTISAVPASGSTFGVGTTTVTVTATDAAGQTFSRTFNVVVNNPVPTLTTISPSSKKVGDAGFTMTVSGTNFMPTSVVRVDGSDRPTTFVGATQLSAAIPSSDMTSAGTETVTVFTPTPGGGTTSGATFTVDKADQTITFAAISGKTYGDAPFAISPTSDSGLAVTVVVTSGPATILGNTVTITGAGTVTLTATQAGDANHNGATDVVRTFVVAKATPTVTVTGGSFPFDGQPHAATATVTGIFNEDLGATTISYTPGGPSVPTAVGSYTAQADFAGNSNYNSASGTATVSIGKADQTIDFQPIPNHAFGDAPITLTATASSGLTVSFAIVSGPATLAGNTLTITGSGTVVVRASQAGDLNYNAAPSVDQSFTVGKATPVVHVTGGSFGYDGNPHPATGSVTGVSGADLGTPTFTYAPGGTAPTNVGTYDVTADFAGNADYNAASATAQIIISKGNQTITFPAIANKVFGDAPFALNATASSGLSVSFSIVSGPATVAGNTLTITGAGAVVVRASQPGDSNFNAAPDVDVTLIVDKATPQITVNGGNFPYDGNPHPGTGTVTGIGGVDLGALTFDYTPGGSTAPVNVGSYTATGNFAGNANYNGVSGSASIHITQATASISLSNLSFTYDGNAHAATATTNPGGLGSILITYDGSVNPPTNAGSYAVVATLSNGNYTAPAANGTLVIAKATATVNVVGGTFPFDGNPHPATGSVIGVGGANIGTPTFTYSPGGASVPVSGGTYAVVGDFAGNANYLPAIGSGSITISTTAATVSLSNLNQTYTGSGLSVTVTTVPAGLSGVSVTYNGSAILPVHPGSYTVVATLTNPNYTASPANGTLVIGKANATLVVNPVTVTYDAAAHPTTGTATGVQAENLGALAITYNPGGATAPTNAGTYVATGTYAGNADYNSGTATANVQINKANQTITFTGPGNQTYGVAPITLSGSASSGLAVSYSISSGPATVVGNTLTITGAGTVVIQASQGGNGNFTAATNVNVTITVAKATPAIVVTGGNFAFDGNAHPATGSVTGVGGANLGTPTFTYTPGGATPPTNVGTYSVSGSFAGDANYNSASGSATIAISGASATLSLSNLNQNYTGNPTSVTVTTSPANLTVVTVTYNGSTTPPTNAGSYAVTASLSNANFTATPVSGTLVIAKVNPTLSVTPVTATYNGAAHGTTGTAIGVQGESLGALAMTYNPGGATAPVNVGTYVATGTYAGNTNYNGGTAIANVVINKANQTITFVNPGNQTFGVAPIALNGSASSGLAITFSVTSGPATVSGSTLTITGAGTVVIQAAQAGNANYNAAANASQSITIAKATPTIVVTGGTFTFDGNPHPAIGSVTGVAGANLGTPTFTYNPGGATPPTAAGTYTVTGAYAGSANYNAVSGTATITINGTQQATLTLSNLSQTYDGTPRPITVTTSPAGLAVINVTYNGSSTVPTHAGSYAVVASLANANFTATPVSGTLVVAKANATLTVTPVNVIYDAIAHGTTGTAVGVQGESLGALTITYATANQLAPINAGAYTATGTFAATTDYNAGTATASIVITKRAMTVTADNKTKFVNAANPALTGVITGAIPADGIGGVFSLDGQQALTPGKYPISSTVSDPNNKVRNYNVTTVSGTLSVVYKSNSGILLPIKADGTSVFAKGALIPVKINAFDVNSAPVTFPNTCVSLSQIQVISGAGTINSVGITGTPDTIFRWDGAEWVFNLSTSALTANTTYVYRIVLGDGTFVDFKFGVK
jgi:hypothetical protein